MLPDSEVSYWSLSSVAFAHCIIHVLSRALENGLILSRALEPPNGVPPRPCVCATVYGLASIAKLCHHDHAFGSSVCLPETIVLQAPELTVKDHVT